MGGLAILDIKTCNRARVIKNKNRVQKLYFVPHDLMTNVALLISENRVVFLMTGGYMNAY